MFVHDTVTDVPARDTRTFVGVFGVVVTCADVAYPLVPEAFWPATRYVYRFPAAAVRSWYDVAVAETVATVAHDPELSAAAPPASRTVSRPCWLTPVGSTQG